MDISNVIGDLDKQTAGVEVEYQKGIRLVVAYSGSPAYRNYLADLMAKARRKVHGKKQLPSDQIYQITTKAMAKHILRGWNDDAFTSNGEPFTYSEKNAAALLQASEIRDFVSLKSNTAELFGVTERDADEDEEGDTSAEADTKSGASVEP